MPEILNRLNQKLTIRLGSDKSIILEPNGKAKISDKDVSSYGVGLAVEEQKIIVLPDTGGSKATKPNE